MLTTYASKINTYGKEQQKRECNIKEKIEYTGNGIEIRISGKE